MTKHIGPERDSEEIIAPEIRPLSPDELQKFKQVLERTFLKPFTLDEAAAAYRDVMTYMYLVADAEPRREHEDWMKEAREIIKDYQQLNWQMKKLVEGHERTNYNYRFGSEASADKKDSR